MQTGDLVEKDQIINTDQGAADGQEDYALTRAEVEQITAARRDRLYRSTQIVSVVFAIISIAAMAGFKMHEGFFDASSRIGILMESVNAQESVLSAPKVNVRTSFQDEEGSRLVIPLTEPIASASDRIEKEIATASSSPGERSFVLVKPASI